MANVSLTWLGHAAFRVDSPGGKRIYVDPWLGNPKCPEGEKEPERVDLIALTHGHDDHVGSTLELAQKFGCPVIALVELRGWLSTKGLSEDATEAANKGGTVARDGIKITLTDAKHSSSTYRDGTFVYLGEPAGLVIEVENGTKLYFAGDTGYFDGFREAGDRLGPFDLAALPIGSYTPRVLAEPVHISPEEAIQAWLDLRAGKFVAIHWGTFALAREPYDEPPKRIAEEIGRRSLDARAVWILKPGETTVW